MIYFNTLQNSFMVLWFYDSLVKPVWIVCKQNTFSQVSKLSLNGLLRDIVGCNMLPM